ncbi:hypothetical protein BpHYR1_002049 [Brachionus plicatilis]|uniref:Uncharacterized protein n=1 Tax=Brachionus plicatilis TaxID=10195 RepID=A0A3M7R2G9_BRAPC|nr:hypothetical protein BpHYR1_002049 [Brachionus plicatilis]
MATLKFCSNFNYQNFLLGGRLVRGLLVDLVEKLLKAQSFVKFSTKEQNKVDAQRLAAHLLEAQILAAQVITSQLLAAEPSAAIPARAQPLADKQSCLNKDVYHHQVKSKSGLIILCFL